MKINNIIMGILALLLVGIIAYLIITNDSSITGNALDLGVYEPVPYSDLSAPAAMLFIRENKNVAIIDISELYNLGHIKGAVNYPLKDGTLNKNLHKLDRNAFYLIYGHYESPSTIAAQRMVDEGFVNVYRLEGGYRAWVEYGYPFER